MPDHPLVPLFLISLLGSDSAHAQGSSVPGRSARGHPALEIGHEATIHSEILGEDRPLLVHLPNGYETNPDARYPVLFLLDAGSNFKHTAGMVHGLAESRAIPRTIVIGIENTDRWRDLTPTGSVDAPGSGGGIEFLAFLDEELVPWVEENYRAQDYRVLLGHSLGGLTALAAITERPGLFQGVIALSPSLEWDEGAQLEDTLAFLEDQDRAPLHLFLALADERIERAPFLRLAAALEQRVPDGMEHQVRHFEGEDHLSVRIVGSLAGLRSVFDAWRLSSAELVAASDADVEAFLARALARYGFPGLLDMGTLIDAGYYGVSDPATAERGMALFEQAVERWPDHPYPLSALGEGLERTGRTEEALEPMEQALAMALRRPGSDVAYFRGMVDRVRMKLGR